MNPTDISVIDFFRGAVARVKASRKRACVLLAVLISTTIPQRHFVQISHGLIL